MMEIIHKLIETEQEHEAAIERIDEIFHTPVGRPKSHELKLLVVLVQKYEEEKYPLPDVDPIEAIGGRMQELALSRRDLEPYLGDRSVVSKIMNWNRELTLDMIRRLHVALRLPVEVLVG